MAQIRKSDYPGVTSWKNEYGIKQTDNKIGFPYLGSGVGVGGSRSTNTVPGCPVSMEGKRSGSKELSEQPGGSVKFWVRQGRPYNKG